MSSHAWPLTFAVLVLCAPLTVRAQQPPGTLTKRCPAGQRLVECPPGKVCAHGTRCVPDGDAKPLLGDGRVEGARDGLEPPGVRSALDAGAADAAGTAPGPSPQPPPSLGPKESFIEAIAVCWPRKGSSGSQTERIWVCDGPTQKLSVSDWTLDDALRYSGCDGARHDSPSERVGDQLFFYCRVPLRSYRRDVSTNYELPERVRQRRGTFTCPASSGNDQRCAFSG